MAKISDMRSMQLSLDGYKDIQITESRTPFGKPELSMSQGFGGVFFGLDNIPTIISALQRLAPDNRP